MVIKLSSSSWLFSSSIFWPPHAIKLLSRCLPTQNAYSSKLNSIPAPCIMLLLLLLFELINLFFKLYGPIGIEFKPCLWPMPQLWQCWILWPTELGQSNPPLCSDLSCWSRILNPRGHDANSFNFTNFFIWLTYSWFMMLCQFLQYSKVTQSRTGMHLLNVIFHQGLSQEIGYSSLCCRGEPGCLFILNVLVCYCFSFLSLSLSLFLFP